MTVISEMTWSTIAQKKLFIKNMGIENILKNNKRFAGNVNTHIILGRKIFKKYSERTKDYLLAYDFALRNPEYHSIYFADDYKPSNYCEDRIKNVKGGLQALGIGKINGLYYITIEVLFIDSALYDTELYDIIDSGYLRINLSYCEELPLLC